MSRTEDDARSGTSAPDAPDDVSGSPADPDKAVAVEDGTVLPTSDWSIDDDPPAKIDPLLSRSSKRDERTDTERTGELPVTPKTSSGFGESAAATTPRTVNPQRAAQTAPRSSTSQTERRSSDNGSKHNVGSGRQQIDPAVTQPVVAERDAGQQAPTQKVAAERTGSGLAPTERLESVAATEVVPQARARTEAVTTVPTTRSWESDDDLGPWQSHDEVIGSLTTPVYGAEPTGNDVEPGRRVVRRTTRILRHIDPWSTFKVGLLFSLVGYLVIMTSGVLLWQVADNTGTLDNIQRWLTSFGWETFELDGAGILTNSAIAGLFLAVGATGGLVMFVTIFNLASDAVGGIRMTVLEEERVRPVDEHALGHVDPSYGLAVDPRGDWGLGD